MGLPILALAAITNLGALSQSTVSGQGSNYSGVWLYTDPQVAGDEYAYGYCTYWAALRRLQIGSPIPNTWGNANTWDDRAMSDGYLVDHTPLPGAVMQTDDGSLGHVAFVERVSPDGSWVISEMNAAGFDEVDQRTFSALAATHYTFIHDRLRGR
ncbi:MAG: hypothetical protein NVS1B10_03640 [Candidatus Saccharimonadales bacterium]